MVFKVQRRVKKGRRGEVKIVGIDGLLLMNDPYRKGSFS
jgi:hypothetical protein